MQVDAIPQDGRPIFVLGAGRCGSTSIQSVLCGTACTMQIEDAAAAISDLAQVLDGAPETMISAAATTGIRNAGSAMRSPAGASFVEAVRVCRPSSVPRMAEIAVQLGYGVDAGAHMETAP